jgi:hypothetical protein
MTNASFTLSPGSVCIRTQRMLNLEQLDQSIGLIGLTIFPLTKLYAQLDID